MYNFRLRKENMPELPEVETIARRLRELVVGKMINNVAVLREKSFQGDTESIIGETITDVSRRAKIIRVHLSNNRNILIHLKMTGQLIYVDETHRVGGGHPTADWTNDLPAKHTRVVLTLSDGATLYFNDMRVFGWLKALSDEQVVAEYSKLGPDVIDDVVTTQFVFDKIKKRTQPIKQVIMDNALMCGLGNIYACDALHLALINPLRRANTLSEQEVEILVAASKTVLNLGIELGGATMDSYRHVDGFSGRYQEKVRVYGKNGEECMVCGTEIKKMQLGGRGTFYCDVCQK